jgi:hypothetical protein
MNERAIRKLMDQGYSYEDAYNIIYGEMPPEKVAINPNFVGDYTQSQSQYDNQDYGTLFAPRDYISSYRKEQRQFDLPGLNNTMTTGLNKSLSLNRPDKESWIEQQQEMSRNAPYEELSKEYDEMFGGSSNTALNQFAAIMPFVNTAGMSTPSALYTSGRAFGAGKTGLGLAGLGLAGLRGAGNILAGIGAQKRQDNTMDWYYQNLNRRNFESQPQYRDDATGLGFAQEGGRQARVNERKMSPAMDLFGRYGEVNFLTSDLPESSSIQSLGYADPGFIGSIKSARERNAMIRELNENLPEDERYAKVRALAFTGRKPTESLSFEEGGMKRYNFLRDLKNSNADFTIDMEDELEDLKEDLFPELFKAGGKKGGIPERYKKRGFSKVGVKKRAPEGAKHKWEVLAKKGDKYKIVKGGFRGMSDFTQHKDKDRQKRFWDRMGGKNSAKAKDPFSPLYWHKRFGTWEDGGEIEEDMAQAEAVAEQQAMVQEQQAMQDQEMVQGAAQEQEAMQAQQQMMAMIVQALQQGATPEQVIELLVKNGIPEEQAAQMVQMIIQQMQGAQQMNYGGLFQTPSFYKDGGIEKYQDGRMIYDEAGNPLSTVMGQKEIYVKDVNDPYLQKNIELRNLYKQYVQTGRISDIDRMKFPSGTVSEPSLTYRVLKDMPSSTTEDTFTFKKTVSPMKMGGETFMGKGPGEKISFNYGGKKYNGTIDRVENGKLYLK